MRRTGIFFFTIKIVDRREEILFHRHCTDTQSVSNLASGLNVKLRVRRQHDGNHGPKLNAGPVIKVNNNQRYATNSETAGFFRHLCMAEEVPVQSFVVRSDMGCGSTIGPITASHLGVRTVDIGLPTFAMHSIRELCGSQDLAHLVKVLTAFYRSRDLP